jgi:hypothetical protein
MLYLNPCSRAIQIRIYLYLFSIATGDQRGYGGLQRLDRDPHPRLHQVLLLLNEQP